MANLKAAQSIGRKRMHDDDENDQNPSCAKRQQMVISGPRGHAISVANTKPADPPLQFSQLPPEIRRYIWRKTWVGRNVILTRGHRGIRGTDILGIPRPVDHKALRVQHVRFARHDWGHGGEPHEDLYMPFEFVTHTSSKVPPPLSLWVNQESRDETLRHFEIAFGMSGGSSTAFFNFDIDTLQFNLHNPLSSAFSVFDLCRLRRLTIPSLMVTGPLNMLPRQAPPKVDNEDTDICDVEFRYVWRILRRWFPSLREINLSMFLGCQRYITTSREINHPLHLALPMHRNIDCTTVEGYCHTCLGIRQILDAYAPRSGPADTRSDLSRMLDRNGVTSWCLSATKYVIGRIPCEKEHGKTEDVTVSYTQITVTSRRETTVAGPPGPPGPPPSANELENQKAHSERQKRQHVARTLEHALGPPGKLEYMVYKM
ncbi:hypothetical protein F5Y04DRAFT_290577 [Hypomontagnella monticulosa]|nr:hypothetical protein F5Y04DRAFT_290577 [Hypomontagnella monticulosa]